MQPGDAEAKLAIADRDSPTIHVFDIRSGSNDPVHSFAVHRAPLTAMSYNAVHDTVISLDERGVPIFHNKHPARIRVGYALLQPCC